jgi:hypothetical protein
MALTLNWTPALIPSPFPCQSTASPVLKFRKKTPPPPQPPPIGQTNPPHHRQSINPLRSQISSLIHPSKKLAPPYSSSKQILTAASTCTWQQRGRFLSYDPSQEPKRIKVTSPQLGPLIPPILPPDRQFPSAPFRRNKEIQLLFHKTQTRRAGYKYKRTPPHPNFVLTVTIITSMIQNLSDPNSCLLRGSLQTLASCKAQPSPLFKELQPPRQLGSRPSSKSPLRTLPMVTRRGTDRSAPASQIQERQVAELALQQRMEDERKKRQ